MTSYSHDKTYSHNTLGKNFDELMNKYDLKKRLEIVFGNLPPNLIGLEVLDAGCGTGWFSKKAASLGATVTSLDIGPQLLAETRKKCSSKTICADICNMPFEDESYDIVVSSECVEHTKNPETAIKEISRILKKNGTVVLTTPNKFWHWSVVVANHLKLRPYDGHENWMGWWSAKRLFNKYNLTVINHKGFHFFPFIFTFTHPLLNYLDRFGGILGPFMVNMLIVAVKSHEKFSN